ncbi:MAG: protein-L-isoaspartate(D-aspartate) O-methyltransferase [Acidobacteria bacterium]|nr:protein-L-isoaspartate(D-aspartate) O-methyltransferase [Acidobacteriota bacterium]
MEPDGYGWEVERRKLVWLLEMEKAIRTPAVNQAFLDVPRHAFVPPDIQDRAYVNSALPIGAGQTISQPLMVAVMTELLDPSPDMTVLEIGTGSGYQAAILSRLVKTVISVERLPELNQRAEGIFRRLGYDNIRCVVGDGTRGWPAEAPYDGIIVTAGAPAVPESLKGQLVEGGRLVIPVGDQGYQQLLRLRRQGDTYPEEKHGGCIFVRLIGEEGWSLE